jgi:hypothetical protein
MRKIRWVVAGGVLVLTGVAALVYWCDLLPLPEVDDGDYPMRPVSALAESHRLYLGGVPPGEPIWWSDAPGENVIWVASNTNWKTIPDPAVKRYPKLQSSRALYGAIEFGKR